MQSGFCIYDNEHHTLIHMYMVYRELYSTCCKITEIFMVKPKFTNLILSQSAITLLEWLTQMGLPHIGEVALKDSTPPNIRLEAFNVIHSLLDLATFFMIKDPDRFTKPIFTVNTDLLSRVASRSNLDSLVAEAALSSLTAASHGGRNKEAVKSLAKHANANPAVSHLWNMGVLGVPEALTTLLNRIRDTKAFASHVSGSSGAVRLPLDVL